MKIWVDYVRTPPDDTWIWCKTSVESIDLLDRLRQVIRIGMGRYDKIIQVMSLDHDLGGDDTIRPIVLWCCENNFWPEQVVVHSANLVGVEWLEGMIERYKQ